MKKYIYILFVLLPFSALAWTGPSAAPPGNNVSAPVNVGSADQFKPGIMGANIINIYGASQYLSFGNTTGASGFGIRNNAGILEYKNSGGAWTVFGVPSPLTVAGYTASGGNVNAYKMEVGGPAPTASNGMATIYFHHHGSIAHQLRYASSTLYWEAAGNGYGTSATPNLTVGGRIDANSAAGSGGIISTGNYGGTGTAAYFPSGIWSNGATAWIYGSRYVNGAEVDTTAGTIRDAGGGWVRTYGATGWYSQTYGGGWHMSDTTWLRAYGNKNVYTPGTVRGDASVDSNQFCDPAHSYCTPVYNLWWVVATYYSDIQLKKDIKDMSNDYGLGAIMKLRPIQFTWKDKTSSEKLGPQIGLVAQEVEQVIPEVVDTMPDKEITNEDGTKETIKSPKSVTYQNLVVPLIRSVQELKALNDAQQREIDALKEQVKQLQSR